MPSGTVAQRILDVVQTLAANPGGVITEALNGLSSGVGDEIARLEQQAKQLVQAELDDVERQSSLAARSLQGVQDRLAAFQTAAESQLTSASRAVTDALNAGTRTIAAAEQQATRLRAGAEAAALGVSEAALVEQRATQALGDAQTAATRAHDQAELALAAVTAELAAQRSELDALVTAAAEEVTATALRASQLLAAAQQRISDEVARLSAAAQQTITALTALPERTMALAEDARRQLAGAVEPNGSLIGLITQALVYLKNELFPDEPKLQVVGYRDPAAPQPGIGLSWADGATSILLAYVPEMNGPRGSLVIETSAGAPVEITVGAPVSLSLKATGGNQSAVIALDGPAAPAADLHVTLELGFDTSALRVDERVVQAQVGTPRLGFDLSATQGRWHYRADSQLVGTHWGVDFARLFEPIPNFLPMAGVGETRTFGVALEDGVFTFAESSAT